MNLQPAALETAALPIELHPYFWLFCTFQFRWPLRASTSSRARTCDPPCVRRTLSHLSYRGLYLHSAGVLLLVRGVDVVTPGFADCFVELFHCDVTVLQENCEPVVEVAEQLLPAISSLKR